MPILGSWFTGFTNLIDFDGRGLDVSSTYYFDDLFKDDANLQSIDISTWNMISANRYATKNNFVTVRRTWPSTTGMLSGTTAINTIIAGNQIYIADSGLSKANANGVEAGLWATGEFTYDNEYTSADTLWFDTTDHLFINTTTARYTRNASASGRSLGTVKWTWVPGVGANAFTDNSDATWIVIGDKDIKISETTTLRANNLFIGVRPTATNKNTNITTPPWGGDITLVTDVRTFGGLKPISMENWFNRFNLLTAFNWYDYDWKVRKGSLCGWRLY